MAYITRDDGEHFVIPSYRDTLTAKSSNSLKKEILLLSKNYGDYITLQRKGSLQYEVAFSSETGYLLGETVWQHFKRPMDMIYCEAIANTNEAILVIVKSGAVYLDGRFPVESIPEELIIFLTQQNSFEIFIYGDVPISHAHEVGKFSFEESSVKSFTILDAPVFPSLPLLKMYQLQLVDAVLKLHGIGVFPIKQAIIGGIISVFVWVLWSYMTQQKEVVMQLTGPPPNPFQGYISELSTPAPDTEIMLVLNNFKTLLTIPGWLPHSIAYANGMLSITVDPLGSDLQSLFDWANGKNVKVEIKPTGMGLSMSLSPPLRAAPTKIYPVNEVVATLADRLAYVYPENKWSLEQTMSNAVYKQYTLTIKLAEISPAELALIAEQLNGLPLKLTRLYVDLENGAFSGEVTFDLVGT